MSTRSIATLSLLSLVSQSSTFCLRSESRLTIHRPGSIINLPTDLGSSLLRAKRPSNTVDDDEDDGDDLEAVQPDIVWPDEDDYDEDPDLTDWIPDRVKSQVQRLEQRIPVEREDATPSQPTANSEDQPQNRPSPYTEEEEEVIAAMGGKTQSKRRRREIGYLGDSSLREIAMDYSVPISYLADVLCMWGVMPPIQIDDVPLGDMVTGEQAFAILEAVNSLDVGALNDRYSNTNLRQLSYEWDIDLQEAFSMAMKEGWSLPFGVETCLRVEQEDELLRVLRHEGSSMTSETLDYDDEDYVYGDPV